MPRLISSILAFRVAIAAQEGGDVNAILDKAEVPRGVMKGNPEYVDLAAERRVWSSIVDATGRDDIGLVCGLRFPTQAMGVLGYAMANAPTLQAAIEKCCSYQKVMGDSMGMVFERGSTHSRIWIDQWSEWQDELRYTVDCFMAAIPAWGSANMAAPVHPRDVGFAYSQPNSIAAHKRVFAPAKVTFDTEVSYQIYDNELLDLPVIGANWELFHAFDQKIEHAIAQLDDQSSWADKVRKNIMNSMKGTTPYLSSVASSLAVSERTLQLRLSDEGTSFSEILNAARFDLAKEFLATADTRNEEIAYLLGYSEESVFSRSFKKWSGLTPSQFRANFAT